MPVEIGDNPVPLPQIEEEVKFLPSGKIIVIIDGATHTLRRPKFREFREFREVLYEEQDTAHDELLKKADALVVEATDGDGLKTPEERRAELIDLVESARRMRADTMRQEETYLNWSRSVVETLSGREINAPNEDLPFLLSTVDFVTAVQRHWRTVPLPSGAR